MTSRDPLLASQAIPGSVSQSWTDLNTGGAKPPSQVAALLQPYRRHTVGTNQS
jgi:hypothetical protein